MNNYTYPKSLNDAVGLVLRVIFGVFMQVSTCILHLISIYSFSSYHLLLASLHLWTKHRLLLNRLIYLTSQLISSHHHMITEPKQTDSY